MSGPKSYSCRVFNKHMLRLFMIQAAIDNLWESLQSRRIVDKHRGVEITNDDFIQANNANYQELSVIPGIKPEKLLDQQQFDQQYNWMQTIVAQHQKFKARLDEQHKAFDRIEEAWQDYLDLELLKKDLDEEFLGLKNQMADYLKSLKIAKEEKEKRIGRLAAMEISYSIPEFSIESLDEIEDIRQSMIVHYAKAKRQIGEEAGLEQNRNPAKPRQSKVRMLPDESEPNDNPDFDLAAMLSGIKQNISRIKSNSQAMVYKKRLYVLLENKKDRKAYFFVELHEDLKKHVDQQQKRSSLEKLNRKIPEGKLNKALFAEINKVRKDIEMLLQAVNIKSDDLTRINRSVDKIIEKQRSLQQQEAASRREQQYIKSNIVAGLNELNYTVADDTELIDLEGRNDFLLSIPDQSNYLNLRFDATGNVLYNFLIPDEPAALSYDAKAIKIAEMQDTCTAFKKVLADLKSRGLNIDLQHEIQISEKALIALPREYRSKLNQAATAKPAKQKSGSIRRTIKK